MAKKRYQPPRLSGTMPGLLKEKGWEHSFDQHRVFADWHSLVDGEVGQHARPLKVVKDVLWLEVANSAWMQQLHYQKTVLLDQLNAHLRISRFRDIRFSVAEEEHQPEQAKEVEQPLRFVPPPQEQVEAFEKQIESIADEAIRESLMRLWYISQACQKRA